MKIVLEQAYSFYQQGLRDHQEDARWPDSDKPLLSQRFFVVCDGVGGCEKGEVASSTVCKSIAKSFEEFDFSAEFTPEIFSNIFDEAYDALDNIAKDADNNMATTMVMACFHAKGCTMAHIGDSRIYHYRKGEGIIYKSEDHSLVNDMVRKGQITPEEAEMHPQSNVITRYMSPTSKGEDRFDATMVTSNEIKAGDVFVLCTDGVTHCVTESQLVEVLEDKTTFQEKIKLLASACLYSQDNNTCFLIPVKDTSYVDSVNEEVCVTKTLKLKKRAYKTFDVESEKHIDCKDFFAKLKRFFYFLTY